MYMLRAVDDKGRVTTLLFETEPVFLRELEKFLNSGQKVEAWVRKYTWERYESSESK